MTSDEDDFSDLSSGDETLSYSKLTRGIAATTEARRKAHRVQKRKHAVIGFLFFIGCFVWCCETLGAFCGAILFALWCC